MDFNFIDKLSEDEIDKLYDDADLLAGPDDGTCYCYVSRRFTNMHFYKLDFRYCYTWAVRQGCRRGCMEKYADLRFECR